MSIKSRVAAAISLHYLIWLALFVVIIAIAFAATGLFLWLQPTFGPAAAAFTVAGSLLVLLGLGLLTIWLISALRRRARKHGHLVEEPSHPQSETFLEDQLRPVLGDRAMQWARANPGLLTAGALSAGVLLAASPALRRTLMFTARPILVRRGLSALVDRFSD
ncbi:hypothetical protein [Salinisphaera sp. Q1T1-3]|uniref:hypothetical protein n=1 Tax=Salinisphaera sp. Q1T1-3 TaxID=2321229 RepID=UPI000E7316ED|nr:hypothetical protein [Salinisphaera sp. Q1T1-3]RJS94660.1 hypothetical protein D3260_02470 [Salinisphaera sp. Q1T1-3]